MSWFRLPSSVLACLMACSISNGSPPAPRPLESYTESEPEPVATTCRRHGDIEHCSLSNGAELLVVERAASSDVIVRTIYRVGATHEGPGEVGMAHFLEHAVHRGSDHFPDPRSHIQALGGQIQATTRPDTTRFTIRVPAQADALTQVLSIEADRMAGRATLTSESIEAEREVVRNELLQHTENSFLALQHTLYQVAYGQYGHGYDVRGPIEAIANISQSSLRSFYRKHYRPSNATVIITGGLSAKSIKEAVGKTVGAVEDPVALTRPFEPNAPTGRAEHQISINQPDATPSVAVVLRGVKATHPHYPSMVAIHQVLAQGEKSRLHTALVDSGLAKRVASNSILTRDASALYFAAEVSEGVQPERLVEAVQDELDGISTGRRPISQQELASLIDDPPQWDQMHALDISSLLAHGAAAGDWRLSFSLPRALESLTPETMAQDAPSVLHPAQRVIGILRPSNATLLPAHAPESRDSTWIDRFDHSENSTQERAFRPMSAREVDRNTIRWATPGGLEVSLLPVSAAEVSTTLTIPIAENDESTIGLWTLVPSLIPKNRRRDGAVTLEEQLSELDSKLTCSYANGFLQIHLTAPSSKVLDVLGLTIESLRSFHVDDADFEAWRRSLVSGPSGERQDVLQIAAIRALKILHGDDIAHRGSHHFTAEERRKLSRLQKGRVATELEKVTTSHWASASIVGDVDPARMRAGLRAAWSGAVEVRRKSPGERVRERPGEVLVAHARGINLDVGMLALQVTGDTNASDIVALSLASYVLGGSTGASLLMRTTRDAEGLSYQAGSVFSPPSQHRHGSWLVHAITERGDGEAGLLSLQKALDELRNSGVERQAFEGVKKNLLEQKNRLLSTPRGVVALMSQAAIDESTVDEVLQQELMESIGVDDVNEALRRHVDSDAMIRIIVTGA